MNKEVFDQLVISIAEYKRESEKLDNEMLQETEREKEFMRRLEVYSNHQNGMYSRSIPSRCGMCGLSFPSKKKRLEHKREVHGY